MTDDAQAQKRMEALNDVTGDWKKTQIMNKRMDE